MPLARSLALELLLLVTGVVGYRALRPKAVIDGYTIRSTFTSTTTVPLGTNLILVCRISGIPHGQQTTYTWTCPNTPCQQTGYAGRKINNNIIAINTTSTSDGGTYTCTVTAGGMKASRQIQINVAGGAVVHSYGRLILHERVITDRHQLQPPNNDTGDGRIECAVSREVNKFNCYGRRYEIVNINDSYIPGEVLKSFTNLEGSCAGIYHYLFLSNGTLPPVTISGTSSTTNSITVNIGNRPAGIERVIIGYHRLDLGQPVLGQFVNNNKKSSITFSPLIPGAKYRITAWGLGGRSDKRRSHSPAVVEVTTNQTTPSPPRDLTITRVFQHGIELNWIPPKWPNGKIEHYILQYVPNGAAMEEIVIGRNFTHYNITGLKRGQTYNVISVDTVNLAGRGSRNKIYKHNPRTSVPVGNSTSHTMETTAATVTTTSTNRDTKTIAAATAANALILLVTITLLVIGGVLIVKRKRHPPTVHYDKEFKAAEQIYDQVDVNAVLGKPSADTKVYQHLDINKKEGENVYASTNTQ